MVLVAKSKATFLLLSFFFQLLVDDNKILAKLGLRINSELCALVCVECGYVVLLPEVRQHLVNFHPLSVKAFNRDSLIEAVSSKVDLKCVMRNWVTPSLEVHSAYDGLWIIPNCLQCSICQCGFGSDKSLGNHIRLKHKGLVFTQSTDRVPMQQLTKSAGPARILFPVTVPPPTPPRSQRTVLNEKEALIEDYVAVARSRLNADHISLAELERDHRLFQTWLHSHYFVEHVRGYSPQTLMSLVAVPKDPKCKEMRLLKAIKTIMTQARQCMKRSSDLMLKRLLTAEPEG